MRKKIVYLFMLLLLIGVTGCTKVYNSEEFNNSKEKSEKEIVESFLAEHTMWYQNTGTIEDSSMFKDAYYKIVSSNGDKYFSRCILYGCL